MSSHHNFNRISDYFTAHKRCLHTFMAHGNPVRNCNGSEFPWRAARVLDAALGALGKLPKMNIAWRSLITTGRYPYKRPVQVLICQSHCFVHGPMWSSCGPLNCLSALKVHYNYRATWIF